MKQKSLSISIPEPCHEKWSEMTPEEKGRHCKSCQKTVIDFTRMPKVKIAEFVTEQNGSLCGRFSSDQLNVELIPPKPSKTWMKYAAILLGLIPTLGYGQEATIPQKPNHEMPLPQITGDIIIETKGEIIEHTNPTIQEIQISGIIIDFESKKILSQASIINYQANKVRKEITVDKNGRFQARIPSNSLIRVSSDGYQSKILKKADLIVGQELQIELLRFDNTPMGIIEMHPPKREQKVYKGRIILHSKDNNKTIKRSAELQAIASKVTQTEDQKVTISKNIIMGTVESEPEEPMQYLFPTIEIVALKTIISQGEIMCGGTTTVEKENWFIRQWKKFKSWVNKSHEEALKNRDNQDAILSESIAIESNDIESQEKIKIEESKNNIESRIKRNDKGVTEVSVYPNPSSGLFTVEVPIQLEKYIIEVTNLKNQLVLRRDHTQFEGMIDLSNHLAGSYIISIISGNQLVNSKMVVKI